MKYSAQEVIQYVNEEDINFIRLVFCDVYGKQKSIAIMPSELSRAFEYGIAFDASAIAGFGDESRCDYGFALRDNDPAARRERGSYSAALKLYTGMIRSIISTVGPI